MTKKKHAKTVDLLGKVREVSAWLDEKQATEIKALDLRGISSVCDAMIVATVKGVRHSQALADHVLAASGESGHPFLGMEGYQNGEWILLDMADVVVHLFLEDVRRFYDLEGLWSEGKEIPVGGRTPAQP